LIILLFASRVQEFRYGDAWMKMLSINYVVITIVGHEICSTVYVLRQWISNIGCTW